MGLGSDSLVARTSPLAPGLISQWRGPGNEVGEVGRKFGVKQAGMSQTCTATR